MAVVNPKLQQRQPEEQSPVRATVDSSMLDRDPSALLRMSRTISAPSTASVEPSQAHSVILQKTTSIAATMSPAREFLFVFTIVMAQLMTQAGLGNTLAILHIIGDSFNVSNPGELAWLIAGYSLTVGSFILIAGRLGDVFGYKRMYVFGFIWYGLWSLVAGLSVWSNHVLFTFCRALQGIGPAILLPNGLAILGATYAPGKRKNMAFALFGGSAPTGAILGNVFGAIFAQLLWWPWTYFSLTIACMVFAGLGAYAIISPQSRSELAGPLRTKIQKLDLPGAIVGIAALVLINVAWNQAPSVGWQEQYVWLILILGFVLLAGFFLIEIRISENPLIPFDALTADVSFVLGCLALGWGCFGIWVFYFWQFISLLRHETPLLGTAHFSPVAALGMVAGVVTGILMSKIRPAYILTIALLCFTTCAILIATAPVDQLYWYQTFWSLCVGPFGMDMSFPAATVMMSNAVKKEHQGIAASLAMTVVNYSISLGLGFAGTVEVHVNHGGGTPELLLKGYRGAFYMAIGLAGGGVLLSLAYVFFTHHRDWKMMQKQADTEKGAIAAKESETEKESGVGNHKTGTANGLMGREQPRERRGSESPTDLAAEEKEGQMSKQEGLS